MRALHKYAESVSAGCASAFLPLLDVKLREQEERPAGDRPNGVVIDHVWFEGDWAIASGKYLDSTGMTANLYAVCRFDRSSGWRVVGVVHGSAHYEDPQSQGM